MPLIDYSYFTVYFALDAYLRYLVPMYVYAYTDPQIRNLLLAAQVPLTHSGWIYTYSSIMVRNSKLSALLATGIHPGFGHFLQWMDTCNIHLT